MDSGAGGKATPGPKDFAGFMKWPSCLGSPGRLGMGHFVVTSLPPTPWPPLLTNHPGRRSRAATRGQVSHGGTHSLSGGGEAWRPPGRTTRAGVPSPGPSTCLLRRPFAVPGPGAPGGHLAGHPRGPRRADPGRRGGPRAAELGDRSPGARPPAAPAPRAGPGSRGAGTRLVAAASGPAAGAGRLPAGGAGASRGRLQPPPPGRGVAGGRGARAASVLPGALRGRRCCPRSCHHRHRQRRRRRRRRLRQPRRRPL
jgi:hypothetical protein